MQIGNSSDPGSINSVMDARPRNAAAGVHAIDRPADSQPPVAESTNVIDLDEFMEAWGSNDSTWDVDANGVVDGGDLGIVLSAITQSATDTDLQSLLDAWGTENSDWDLNGDGTVDGADLGIYLNSSVPENQESTPYDPSQTMEKFNFYANKLADAVMNRFDDDGDGRIHVEQFPVAFDNVMAMDADGDDHISSDELVTYLNQQATDRLENDPHADLSALIDEMRQVLLGGEVNQIDPIGGNLRAHAARAFKNPAMVDTATREAVGHVRDVLGTLGHGQVLPGNLSDVLSRIAFKDTSAEAVLHQLRQELPGGGIEATA